MNAPTGRIKRSTILVVDDVEGNRQILCRRLEPFGYDLHAVDGGEAALEFIRTQKPDLVLLDYMMPHMSGLEVLRLLRQDWQTACVPVIMVTARAESDSVVSALDAGADDYVTKPIDFDVLRARIETQLAKQRSSNQLRQVNAALDERATMRVLAFDELKDELEREIIQRRQLEKSLAEAQEMVDTCRACGRIHQCSDGKPGIDNPAAPSPDRLELAARTVEMIDMLSRAVASGKPVNSAMLAALRTQVGELGRV